MRKQLRCSPSIEAVAIAPPAVMSAALAAAAEQYTTSLIYSHDPIPRLSPIAVQNLRNELLQVDWTEELRRTLLEAEYVQVCYMLLLAVLLLLL